MLIVFSLGVVVLTAIGWQTSQPPKKQSAFPDDPLEATNKFGVTLRDAQTKSLHLHVGMPQDEVASALCKPDKTSVETYGTQISRPWNGFEWIYYWGPRIWRFDGKNPHNTLTVIFERSTDNNNWAVNTWIWSGPP